MVSTFFNFKCLFFHYESRKTPLWNAQKRIVTLYNALVLTPLPSGLWDFSVWLLPSIVGPVPLFERVVHTGPWGFIQLQLKAQWVWMSLGLHISDMLQGAPGSFRLRVSQDQPDQCQAMWPQATHSRLLPHSVNPRS